MISRRQVLLGGLRALAVAAIGAVAVKLGLKTLIAPDHTCMADGVCRTCGRLSECILPQAQSTREAIK